MLRFDAPGLKTLIGDIEDIRRASGCDAATVSGVAARLAQCGSERKWLADRYRKTDSERYLQHVLYVSPDRALSIVALAWLPRQRTPIHDHSGWCAVGVYEGAERETRYRLCRDAEAAYLAELETRTLEPGQHVAMLADGTDLHRVCNAATETTISLHVYGLDVARAGTSIKSCYDALPIRN